MTSPNLSVGKNIQLQLSPDGTTMTLVIDLSKEFGPSSSGKSIIIASSEGNADIPEHPGMKFGLNVYRKP